jgi:hypothetical protein
VYENERIMILFGSLKRPAGRFLEFKVSTGCIEIGREISKANVK